VGGRVLGGSSSDDRKRWRRCGWCSSGRKRSCDRLRRGNISGCENRASNKQLRRWRGRQQLYDKFGRGRGMLAKMRLVGRKVPIENCRGVRGGVLRAHAEDMFGVAAKHTTKEANMVNWIIVFDNGRLINGHGLFGWSSVNANRAVG
jgi:hypothetical protein